MRFLLHLVLATCLLLQGGLAAAMPIPDVADSTSHASMPCHHDGAAKTRMPCCAKQCGCEALCTGAVLPLGLVVAGPVFFHEQTFSPPSSSTQAAYSFTPLRPPIEHTA